MARALGCCVALGLALFFTPQARGQAASSGGAPKSQPTAELKAQIERVKQLSVEIDAAFEKQQYLKGLPLAREGVKICLRLVGEEREETAFFLNQQGYFQSLVGDHAGSLQTHTRALAIRRKVHGNLHQHTALSLGHIGGELNRLGRYSEALPNFEEALAIYRKVLGPRRQETAEIQGHRAFTLSKLNRHAEAMQEAAEQVEILTELLGDAHSGTLLAVHNYAGILRTGGDLRGSLRQYERVVDGLEKTLGPKHYTTLDTLGAIASLRSRMGDYVGARTAGERYLKHTEQNFGELHFETAIALAKLCRICLDMGDYPAMATYAGRIAKFPDNQALDLRVASLLHDMGYCCVRLGRHADAFESFKRAIEVHTALDPAGEMGAAESMQEMAKLYAASGQIKEMREISEKLLAHYTSTQGEDSLSVAEVRADLAYALAQQDEVEPALRHAQAALVRMRQARGELHPDIRQLYANLGLWLSPQERWPEVFQYLHASNRVAHGCLTRLLPMLDEPVQQAFARRIMQPEMSLSVSLAMHRQKDPAVRALSAGWAVNTKGLAQEALAQRVQFARGDTANSEAIERLMKVRSRLASMRLAPSGDDASVTINELNQLEKGLSERLASAGVRMPVGQNWIEIDHLQRSLDKEQVLVTILRYSEFKIPYTTDANNWRADRYAAWVIPPEGEVQLIDLGDAAQIDQHVAVVTLSIKTMLEQQESLSDEQLQQAANVFAKALTNLSVYVLRPITKQCPDAKELLISPDGPLWLVPWAGLLATDSEFVIEKYRVRLLISGREIVTQRDSRPAGRSLIVADPDFDLDPAKGEELTAAVLSSGKLPAAPESAPTAAGLEVVRLAQRLPATLLEAELVEPSLTKYVGRAPAKLLGQHALEGLVKSVHSPKVMLLSTHGFFLPDAEGQGAGLVSPLVRCGVALSSCNHREAGKSQDGVLTGLEILGIDLSGTELVVLSACNTATGEVRQFDGVSSLRQAFQLAGARSVVATLWSVGDQNAMRQTVDFFDFLATGEEPAKALQSAQLAAIKRLREQGLNPSPLYWAAFTITGIGSKPAGAAAASTTAAASSASPANGK